MDTRPLSPGDRVPPRHWWQALAAEVAGLAVEAIPPLHATPTPRGTRLIYRPTPTMDAVIYAELGGGALAAAEVTRVNDAWKPLTGGRRVACYEYNGEFGVPIGSVQRLHYTRANDWRFVRTHSYVAAKTWHLTMTYLAYRTPYTLVGGIPHFTGKYESYEGLASLPLVEANSSGTTAGFLNDIGGADVYPFVTRPGDLPTMRLPNGFITNGLFDFGIGQSPSASIGGYWVPGSYPAADFTGLSVVGGLGNYYNHWWAFVPSGSTYTLAHAYRRNGYGGPGYLTFRTGTITTGDPLEITFGSPVSWRFWGVTGTDGSGNAIYGLKDPPPLVFVDPPLDGYVSPPSTHPPPSSFGGYVYASDSPPDFGVYRIKVTQT